MNAWKLQQAGYFCTLINDGNIKVEYYPAGGLGRVDWADIEPYDGSRSLDQRMALGWERAMAHWTMRRLAGEV